MFNKSSFKMIGFLVLAVFGFSSIQAASFGSNKINVNIEPEGTIPVKLGQNVTIMCRTAGIPLQACRFTIPKEESYHLRENSGIVDGISYAGTTLENGDCGLQIFQVEEKHDGNITCSVTPKHGTKESSMTVRLIVASPPMEPRLELSEGSTGYRIYKKDEILKTSCVVAGGKPAADVALYLDDDLLTIDQLFSNNPKSMNHRFEYGHHDEFNRAEKNYSHKINPEDNGKRIRCVANHISLDRPLETSQEIEVYYKPLPQDSIERFGYVVGRTGRVNVTVNANPRPNFVWIVDGEPIHEGNSDQSGRLQALTPLSAGKGLWNVVLTIDSMQKSDTEKTYELRAENVEGPETYRIVLSTSSEPAGVELDAGSIIGIVIGVMLLLLAVFIAVFARATGRWCFAGKSEKRAADETDLPQPAESVNLLRVQKSNTDDTSPRRSDTESTGRYSRTEVDEGKPKRKMFLKFPQNFFKKNKDKLFGTADTDTIKTTVDDEKSQGTELTSGTPTSGEGGIVYAELDLANRQDGANQTPPRVKDEKTEYAEILYTKTNEQNSQK